ncbi:phenylacetaldehyde reductase-like [Phragmites australis]|uniref:phenylacetaldehyde reductase-like n=1 Tax=Phragmites australis TaxID=29695 RepID=UPI002D7763D9|nr:phenylacetaldehyde reductase-like [Phragmites australis]
MASGEAKGETVLVTGASGFIGSTLVRLLLDRGYSVHAGVLNPDDKAETDHLHVLAASAGEGRLRIFRCDLLDGAALHAAARGCSGVFHLASPCTVDRVVDPQKQLMVPAVEGTLNVLRAAKEARGVRRVVVTSSISAIVPSPGWPAGEVRDERCWTDIDYCEKNGVWYPASKTLAEKAAWKFAEENGLDVVVVNPGTVLGPMIQPTINASMAMFLRLLEGCTEEYADFFMGAVHVEDVALAHILLFENPSASGRHICVESIAHWSDFAAGVAELYPNYKVPKFPKDTQPGLLRAEAASKKLIALGLQFSTVEKIIRDAVESLKSRGYISRWLGDPVPC